MGKYLGLTKLIDALYFSMFLLYIFLGGLTLHLFFGVGVEDLRIIILFPLFEEIFFRGYLQGNFKIFFRMNEFSFLDVKKNSLKKKFKKSYKKIGYRKLVTALLAVISTASLFSISHLLRYGLNEAFITYPVLFLAGLFLGVFMEVKMNIMFPIILHILWNASILTRRHSEFLITGILVVIILFFSIYSLYRSLSPQIEDTKK